MSNLKFSSVSTTTEHHSLKDGFTIVELLVAAAVASIIGGSALYVLNDFHESSLRDSNRRSLISSSDTTLRVITNEVKQSLKIYPSKELMKKDMGNSGGGFFGGSNKCLDIIPNNEFLFALKLPDQVMLKGDYYKDLKKSDYKTKRIKKFIKADCNYIFYGIKRNPTSNIASGPYSLYRLGYDQTSEGYYNAKSVSRSILNTSISDSINSPNGQPSKCFSNYHSVVKYGVQICVDKISQKTINLSLVSMNPNRGNTFYHTRSSSASSVLSEGGTIFDRRDQPPLCTNAVFLLDISGSMGSYMQLRNPRITRIELARVEIINVIRDCPDNSKINIHTFSSRGRGASFKPYLVPLNDRVRAEIKTWLSRQRPGGGTYPWDQMEKPYNNKDVDSVHIVGDGVIYRWGTFLGTYADPIAPVFKQRNSVRLPKPLTVYSYSLDNDFCTGNHRWKNYWFIDPKWMGSIGDTCKVVK